MSRWTTRLACAWATAAQTSRKREQARFDPEAARVAVPVDRLPVDVLEDDVRLARGRHAGVDQARDVRVGEPREDRALAAEALLAGAADEARVQELDGDAPLEAPVAAARQPDRAHSALADRLDQGIGADRLSRQRRRRRMRRSGALEETAARDLVLLRQERLEVRGDLGLLRAELLEPDPPLLGPHVHRAIEMRLDRAPAIAAQDGHGLSRSRLRGSSGGGRGAPSPSCAGRFSPTRPASRRSPRRRSRRRTSGPRPRRATGRRRRGAPARRGSPPGPPCPGIAPALSSSSVVISNSPPRFCARRSRA